MEKESEVIHFNMLSEQQYYLPIEKYLRKKFNCTHTGINKGNLSLGLVDVVGSYETSSEYYSDIELIIIEVKTTTSSFGKSLGQTIGYSIFGERCYLAVTFSGKDGFSEEQKYMANHLGVGLIKIPIDSNFKPRTSNIEMVISSKKHVPIDSQKQYLLHSIGLAKCSSCGIYDNNSKMNKIRKTSATKGLFMRDDIRKLYLCNECYIGIVPEKERIKRQNIIDSGKKAARTRKNREAARKAVKTRENKRLARGEDM